MADSEPRYSRAIVTLTVVIPTLNEASTLPGLLTALGDQTRPPDEIIVADAGSTDDTPDIARRRGARVVPGGMPAVGRNAGARAAAGEMLLFLDADVLPKPDFIEGLLEGFEASRLDVATCLIEPLSDRPVDRISADATNVYLQVVQSFSPRAPGFCILARSSVHATIGGFDESVKLAEDHDYVQRAAKVGRFGVITRVKIPVSMRRLDKEGLTRLAVKYLWCEMHALAGIPIRSTPFAYEFGAHTGEPQARERLVDIGQLRRQLGRFSDPIDELSAVARRRLGALAQQEVQSTREALQALTVPDLHAVGRYLRRRRALIRLTRRQARKRPADLPASREWLLMGESEPEDSKWEPPAG